MRRPPKARSKTKGWRERDSDFDEGEI